MSGNWGSIPFRRSGGSQLRRIVLSIASVVAGVALVWLTLQLPFAGGQIDGLVIVIGALLLMGVLWGLRPWSRG